jgi:hypothetical protein
LGLNLAGFCAIRGTELVIMRPHHHGYTVMDRASRVLFPRFRRSARRKNMKFLLLSILLGCVFCLLFGGILWLLSRP